MERASEKMDHIDSDAVAIFYHMQHQEKELFHKRKFLMGLSAAPGFVDKKARSHAGNQSILPESFLRKDDVFYEDVKQLVEKGFGASNADIGQPTIYDDIKFCNPHNVLKTVMTLLDDLSNNGLYRLAKVVTRDSVTLHKTRSQMKLVIKKGMSDMLSSQCHSDEVKIRSEISQLLKNPKNFRQNHVKHLHLTLKFHRAAVLKVLNGIEDLSSQTLRAMHRKLRGTHGYMPQLHTPRSGWSRDRLIDRVRMLCLDMIRQLGETDKLQEPLAKAMVVACLSSKLASGYQDLSMDNFVHVTPELEALQNEIVKAIQSLGRTIKKEEIRMLRHLLDPQSQVENRGLKSAIKNMLIEFLFECSDMEAIPDSLLDALSVINKTPCNPRRFLSKEILEEEVECILNLGAHIKQILWDYVPGDKFDQDFADAYMEELVESDDGDIFYDDDDDDDDDDLQLHTDTLREVQMRFNDFSEEVQSTGDPEQAIFNSQGDSENTNESSSSSFGPTSFANDVECTNSGISGGGVFESASSGSVSPPLGSPTSPKCSDIVERQDPEDNVSVDSVNPSANCYPTVLCSKQIPMTEYQNITRNQYVPLQEVCDQTSVVAYQLIGHVLEGFGRMEALALNWDDESYLRGEYSRPEHFQDPVANAMDKGVGGAIIVSAVHKVIPSFSNSKLERVKEFMSV